MNKKYRPTLFYFMLLVLSAGITLPVYALDLDPRKWNHIPVGINFGGFAYTHTNADIFVDPTLKLVNVKLELETLAGKYIRSFELFNKSARLDITQGFQQGKWEGLLNGVSASTSRSGLTDTFVRFAINLYGSPPLNGKEFAKYRAKMDTETIVGVALVTRIPTGDYQEDKLLNLGQNRFVFRPQLGVVHTRGKWTAELTNEVAFYTDNDEFFNGKSLEKEPLYIIHGHIIRAFKPGQWASISMGYDYGGAHNLDGIDKNDKNQNIAWKFSYSHPINRTTGFKFSYIATETREKFGFDSDTLAASFSAMW